VTYLESLEYLNEGGVACHCTFYLNTYVFGGSKEMGFKTYIEMYWRGGRCELIKKNREKNGKETQQTVPGQTEKERGEGM